MNKLRVRCENLFHQFASSAGVVEALGGVSFETQPGEFVCLVGPSGCGKSTLLRVLAGLVTPTSGRVDFGLPPGIRPSTALVFQEGGVFPWMTVRDNVAFGLEMHGVSREERHRRADDILREVGLEGFAGSWPHELSVGMRQRVNVARAFISEVDLLLMDEPFGALDALSRRRMQEELLRLWRLHRHTLVFVTHDVDEAIALADRILVMTSRPGRILEEFSLPPDRDRGPAMRRLPEVRTASRRIWELVMTAETGVASV